MKAIKDKLHPVKSSEAGISPKAKLFNRVKKIKDGQGKLRREVKVKTMGYILTALGLVAGLAWNEAIRGLIDVFVPLDKNSMIIKFVYAILVTMIVVLITVLFVKSESKKS